MYLALNYREEKHILEISLQIFLITVTKELILELLINRYVKYTYSSEGVFFMFSKIFIIILNRCNW